MSRADPRAPAAGRPVATPAGDVVAGPRPPVVRAPTRRGRRLLAPALLAMLVLAAVAARIPELGQPLWGDEVAAARAFSHHDVRQVLASVSLRKNEPPLWYLLAWAVQRAGDLVGATPRAVDLRIVSMGASVLTVVGVFAYARRSLGLAEAVAAAAGVAFGAQFVLHGAELRGYAVYSMLAVGFALLVESAVRSDARRWPVLLALVTAAGCLTEYLFLLTVAAGGVFLWTARTRPGRLRVRAGAAIAVGVLALVPWLPSVVPRLHRFGYVGAYGGHTVVSLPWNLFMGYQHGGALLRDEQVLLFVLAVVGAIMLIRHERTRLAGLCAVVPPLVGAIVWALGKPVFDPRNFMAAAPFLAIAVITPLNRLPSERARTVIAAACVVAMAAAVTLTQLPLGRTPYDAIAQNIAAHGWRYSSPIVYFGPRDWSMKLVTWSLPRHQWMVRSVGAKGVCTNLYAIVEDRAGARWVRRVRRHEPIHATTFPAYTHPPEGRRAAQPVEVVALHHVSPTELTLARLYGGQVFVSAPAPRLTLDAPQPKPYPSCGTAAS
jgi:Dolichyl-phosphate-mannose-protein mannosyltransferase